MSKQATDWQARQDAIDPSRSFLIQAPAGSGKTELLTDRILALLPTVNKPEELLAITFTRKAAAEMHARVLKKLQKAQSSTEPQAEHEKQSWNLARKVLAHDQALGWDLLNYPARLSVKTIDSFCASLVKKMPYLSKSGGAADIADSPRDLYAKAAQELIRLAGVFPEVDYFLKHLDLNLANAQNLLISMLEQRDQWLAVVNHQNPDEIIDGIEEHLSQLVGQELEYLNKLMPMSWHSQLSPFVHHSLEAFRAESTVNVLFALEDWYGEPLVSSLHEDPEILDKWQAFRFFLLTGSGTLRKTVDKNMGFQPKTVMKTDYVQWLKDQELSSDGWVKQLNKVCKLPRPHMSQEQRDTIKALLQCIKLAYANLRLIYAQEHQLDYIEIAQQAIEALGGVGGNPSDVLLSLDAQIKHLLIDEFQDTSQTQIDLMNLLTSGWEASDGRTLFLVGDPMQSIYRFRKADVGLFLNIAKRGHTDNVSLNVLTLTDNFRSQQGIVDWVNHIFKEVFPDYANADLGAIDYTPSTAFNGLLAGDAVQLHVNYYDAESKEEKIDESCYKAALLAKEAFERHSDKDHPVAILLRARTHIGSLLKHLYALNVPVKAVDFDSLSQRPAISDLLQIIQVLLHPEDRAAWLALLRSPLCGLKLSSLLWLSGDENQTESFCHLLIQALRLADMQTHEQTQAWSGLCSPSGLLIEENEYLRLQHVATVMLQAIRSMSVLPFTAQLDAVWQALGGSLWYGAESEQEDINAVFQLLERLAPYGEIEPTKLIEHIHGLFAAPQTSGRAVEIMTMHKSKGLQFEEVILFGLNKKSLPNKQKLLQFEQSSRHLLIGPIRQSIDDDSDPISSYILSRDDERNRFELQRLFYVAATRACQRLHLFADLSLGKTRKASPQANSLISMVWPYINPPELPVIESPVQESLALEVQADAAVEVKHIHRFKLGQINNLAQDNPAQVVDFAGSTKGGWRFDPAIDAAVGTVVHAWLNQLGKDSVLLSADQLEQRKPLIERQLLLEGLSSTQAQEKSLEVLKHLQLVLLSPVGSRLLQDKSYYREWALSDHNEKLLVIDLAKAGEDAWELIDYKTSKQYEHETKAQFENRLKAEYKGQLERYKQYLMDIRELPVKSYLYALATDSLILVDDSN